MPSLCDVCSVGHITRDRVRIGNRVREQPGGAAYYLPLALSRFGRRVSVVTRLTSQDRAFLLDELERERIDVSAIDSPSTTTFDNIYSGDDLRKRVQRVDAVACDFLPADLSEVRARFIHLGPLTSREISLEVIRAASARADVCLDVQGLTRRLNGRVVENANWAEMKEGLGFVRILKANHEEATILSGEDDPEAAAWCLAELVGCGKGEVVVTLGHRGAVVCSGDQQWRIPPVPASGVVDITGTGDTFAAAYLHCRLDSDDLEYAGRFAAAAASLALAHFGPSRATQKEVTEALAASDQQSLLDAGG